MADDDKDFQPTTADVEEEDSEKEITVPAKRRRTDNNSNKKSTKNNDEERVFELSSKRRVIVRLFDSGEPSVDIREVYKDKNTGEQRRGKGICLPMAQWKRLKELLPEVDEAIKELKGSD